MISRFTLAALLANFALTGCAKHSTGESAANFSSGPTLVTVTHLAARTDDGAPVFVTVDGNEAGALPTGQSVELHIPAGKHQIGGYARSLVGRVTIAPVEVTTTPDGAKHIAYSVAKGKAEFAELGAAPEQQQPTPQA